MASFDIKKTNNGEFKEIEKTFVLDTNKFRGNSSILYFNVLGEEFPAVFDLESFKNIMVSQINQGFMESLEYKDGLLIATTRDGNTIKRYTYDFGWSKIKGNSSESKFENKAVEEEKHLVLDVSKFRGKNDTLYFNVLGEEKPEVFDISVFVNKMIEQINQGLVESLEYDDGLLKVIINDGNTAKKYIYDFGWDKSKDSSLDFEVEEKHFVVDINKFFGTGDTLSFYVEGEENPVVFSLGLFLQNMVEKIDRGSVESLDYKDGILVAVFNDGKKIKKYTYDFGINRFKGNANGVESDKKYTRVSVIEKHFVLDVVKYRGHGDALYFNIEGEDTPEVFDVGLFINDMATKIEKGLVESLELNDDVLEVVINDGKTIKKYTYDFGWKKLDDVAFGMGTGNSLDELKGLIYRVVAFYKETPNYTIDELKNVIFKILSYYNEKPNYSMEDLKSLIFKIVSYYNESPDDSLEQLKCIVYKIVSCYNEHPNREIMSKQKYIRMIFDIMDGDRLPVLDSKEEVLRVFQTYHGSMEEILSALLNNVIFYDENDNVLEYPPYLRKKKLEMIKNEVFTQMQIKMLMFAATNDANDIYQAYNENVFIEPVQIAYKYLDENGNEIEPPIEGVENGTILSLGREIVGRGFQSIKSIATNGASFVAEKAANVLEKVREHKRTK